MSFLNTYVDVFFVGKKARSWTESSSFSVSFLTFFSLFFAVGGGEKGGFQEQAIDRSSALWVRGPSPDPLSLSGESPQPPDFVLASEAKKRKSHSEIAPKPRFSPSIARTSSSSRVFFQGDNLCSGMARSRNEANEWITWHLSFFVRSSSPKFHLPAAEKEAFSPLHANDEIQSRDGVVPVSNAWNWERKSGMWIKSLKGLPTKGCKLNLMASLIDPTSSRLKSLT